MNKTFIPISKYNSKKWYIVDANNKPLGRVATTIAKILQGKHKVDYHPAVDNGDYVIVTNAKNIQLTGNKEDEKIYFSHSGRPGGSKKETVKALRARLPERIIEKAVKGMLPKGPLGREMFRRLKVFSDSTHVHTAQNPQLFNL
jgi:large subunit ribosomal protein L13